MTEKMYKATIEGGGIIMPIIAGTEDEAEEEVHENIRYGSFDHYEIVDIEEIPERVEL